MSQRAFGGESMSVINPLGDVQDLPYGDLAIALYASSLPERSAPLDTGMVASYAREGIRALGGYDAVRKLHDEWLSLNGELIASRISPEAHAAALRRLWPDPDRLESCIGHDADRLLPA